MLLSWNSVRVLQQRACINSGAPNDCFLSNTWIFYSLREARNFCMTVTVVYNFRRLSNKIPTSLPRCRLGSFFVISFIFLIRFCFTFLFSRLNSQRAIKIYSSKGIILLWSASPFVCDINLIYFSCDSIDTFGRNWRYPYYASCFRKTAAGGIMIFFQLESLSRKIIFNRLCHGFRRHLDE